MLREFFNTNTKFRPKLLDPLILIHKGNCTSTHTNTLYIVQVYNHNKHMPNWETKHVKNVHCSWIMQTWQRWLDLEFFQYQILVKRALGKRKWPLNAKYMENQVDLLEPNHTPGPGQNLFFCESISPSWIQTPNDKAK